MVANLILNRLHAAGDRVERTFFWMTRCEKLVLTKRLGYASCWICMRANRVAMVHEDFDEVGRDLVPPQFDVFVDAPSGSLRRAVAINRPSSINRLTPSVGLLRTSTERTQLYSWDQSHGR